MRRTTWSPVDLLVLAAACIAGLVLAAARAVAPSLRSTPHGLPAGPCAGGCGDLRCPAYTQEGT